MMRIVVTGATSLLGIALIKECIANGDTILIIIRENTKRINRLPKSALIQIEFADLDTLYKVQGDGKPYDVFYHFAWGHTVRGERDLPICQEDNIRTTLDAVNLADKLGCKRFIGAGSQAEYGIVAEEINEETNCKPITAYGMAKLSAYMLSSKMCEQLGIKHVWARIFSVYGCNDNAGTMIDYAINRFLKDEEAYFSAATNTWNYLNEKDAGVMFYLMGKENIDSGIFCVASNNSKELKQYIMDIKDATETKSVINFATESKDMKVVNLNVNIQKVTNAIKYIPQVNFIDGIKAIVQDKMRGDRPIIE